MSKMFVFMGYFPAAIIKAATVLGLYTIKHCIWESAQHTVFAAGP